MGASKAAASARVRTLPTSCAKTFGLTGTHVGCEHGVCGACTVVVEGVLVRSCLMLAVQREGREVTTIEGIASDQLHGVQQAFWDHHALQCGFCTPGMVLTVVDLVGTGVVRSRGSGESQRKHLPLHRISVYRRCHDCRSSPES